ncbi:transposase domain-containing protein [Streptosporangium sp. NPDC050284]|uniref:transposase domain-containing protein n=1 Tax=Streptosporangium sp. NPDC050284 TaxID=3366193 RepID=UPI0037BC739E
MAAGRFAAGHLGALTPFLPFELVDAFLQEHRALQRRLRDLPSGVGVYFLPAMCLFPEVRYRLVWQKMTSGLGDSVPAPNPRECPARNALPAASLVDTLRLVVAPAVTGSGRRLFDHPSRPVGFRLVHHEVTAKGLLLLQYETAGAAPTAEYEGVTAFVQHGDRNRIVPCRCRGDPTLLRQQEICLRATPSRRNSTRRRSM